MKYCLNVKCNKEFQPIHERAKFCSNLCRATHHQNLRLAKKKVEEIMSSLEEVELIEKGEKAAVLFDKLLKELGNPKLNGRKNPLENAARGRDENGVNNDEVEKDLDTESILKEIKAIESEKIPAERNTSLGRKVWQKEQINRISGLKSKLK